MNEERSNREGRTIRKLGVMEGILFIHLEELGEPAFRHTKVTNGVPAPHDLDGHVPGELMLLILPLFVPHSALVSTPDTSEPFARFLLLQNAKVADHPCQATTGEAAAREAKEKYCIAS